MKTRSIAVAALMLGMGLASTAQAGPGGSAGYPCASCTADATQAAPARVFSPVIPAGWAGNDGDICRNGNLICRGIGHGPIGWYCSGCGFAGWWSAD